LLQGGKLQALRGKNPLRSVWIPRRMLFLILAMGSVFLLLSFSIFIIEIRHNPMFRSFWDGVWWFFITATTTGYGDKYPITPAGRAIAIVTILFGMITMSLVTASISSALVGRRLKEERGLGEVKSKGHILICGWNKRAKRLIELISEIKGSSVEIVLVNKMEEEDMLDVIYGMRGKARIRFVKGDQGNEATLRRAGVTNASIAFILSDAYSGEGSANPDEKAALVTLTIKSMEPRVRICAEVVDPENREHLLRAGADEIVVHGEYVEQILAHSILNLGISDVMRELVVSGKMRIHLLDIPREFNGRRFSELSEYLRERNKVILIGMFVEAPEIDLESILTDDMSRIDFFIKRMFEEAGMTRGTSYRPSRRVLINPPDDLVIEEGCKAIVIS